MKITVKSRSEGSGITALLDLETSGGKLAALIDQALAPDNKLPPPGRIESWTQDNKIFISLEGFNTESLARAVTDILESADLVENIILELEKRSQPLNNE